MRALKKLHAYEIIKRNVNATCKIDKRSYVLVLRVLLNSGVKQ